MEAVYDTIGINYSDLRRPDSRIAAMVSSALGQAKTVLNVGAGTGSYEPAGRQVTAVEPSPEMIRQRRPGPARVIRGAAESLPFDDGAFDASMAVLTVHHWMDKQKGLAELRRVTRGPVVVLTFDPAHRSAWLNDYFPELVTLDEAQMPRMTDYAEWLGPVRVSPVLVPHDCTDGFLHAYWRRPEAYLDEKVRSGISSFWRIDGVEAGLRRLADDLGSGEWPRRYSEILALEGYDAGYRLVTTR